MGLLKENNFILLVILAPAVMAKGSTGDMMREIMRVSNLNARHVMDRERWFHVYL